MSAFEPVDADWEARLRSSFARQTVMTTFGATLGRVAPGEVEILLPYRADLCQQHGFLHAGVVSTIADSAGGYAGFTLFPPDASILTVEFKINMLAPADGDRLRAVGRVYKPGRTLTICQVEAWMRKDGRERACAVMQQTLMTIGPRPDIAAAG